MTNAGPGVEPRAECPESPVIRGARKPGEAQCRHQELGASVGHAYWMTWSARSSNVCGIVRPSALAVLRLMASSNFVGCSMGLRHLTLAPVQHGSHTGSYSLHHPYRAGVPW